MMMTSNTTQGTSTTQGTGAPVTSYSDGSFADNKPSVHEQVTSSTDRIMIFMTAGVNHTFTVPAGGLVCDILMIGGGGFGFNGGGGGAGACIVAINQTLPAGSCVVNVGDGSVATYGVNGVNGYDSFITVGGVDRYRAKGGGFGGENGGYGDRPGNNGGCGGGADYNTNSTTESGGQPVFTNVVNGSTTGPSTASTYVVLGMQGANNGTVAGIGGGGGGIATAGTTGGVGGNGAFQVFINSQAYVFRSYFANGGNNFGVQNGTTGNYYIGGGGGGYSSTNGGHRPGGLGTDIYGRGPPNSGSGGWNNDRGGSGIIIIRYKNSTIPFPTTTTPTTYTHTPTSTTTLTTTLGTPSIELVRGTQGDSNTDYKIGNYNGDFIVKSSVSSVDSDYIRMLGTNGAIYNFTNSLYWTQTSDRRIKENIARASYDMCYDNIDKLELNRFNYIKEFNTGNKDTNQLGFIAQEIKEIFPKAVFTNNYNGADLNIQDMLSIDIGQINYTLYGAVKKLMEINKDKEARLKRLEGLLNIEDSGSSGNVVVDSSNVVVDSSNVVIDSSNMVIESSNAVVDSSNVVVDSSNAVVDSSNFVVDSSNVVIDSSNVVVDTSNITIDTSNLLDTPNIAIDTSNLLDTSSNIVIDTINLLDTSNIAIDTSNLLDTSSNILDTSSNI